MAQWKNLNFTGNPRFDAEINRRFRYAFEHIDVAQIKFKLNDIEGTLSLDKGGTGAILAEPDEDSIMFFDSSQSSIAFLNIGDSLKIIDSILNTIQDISIESAPTFAGLTITGLSGILKASSGVIETAISGSDYEEPLEFTAPLQRNDNTVSIDGLTQTITIPDTDGTSYHHLDFTCGILTGYEKNTTP